MFAERSFTPTLNLNINVNQGGNTTNVSVTDETRYTRHEIVVSGLGCAMWSYTLLWWPLIRNIRTHPLSSPNTTQVSSVPGEVDVTWSGEGTALIQVSQLRNCATFNTRLHIIMPLIVMFPCTYRESPHSSLVVIQICIVTGHRCNLLSHTCFDVTISIMLLSRVFLPITDVTAAMRLLALNCLLTGRRAMIL